MRLPLASLVRASLGLYEELAARFEFDRTRSGALELVESAEELAHAAA